MTAAAVATAQASRAVRLRPGRKTVIAPLNSRMVKPKS